MCETPGPLDLAQQTLARLAPVPDVFGTVRLPLCRSRDTSVTGPVVEPAEPTPSLPEGDTQKTLTWAVFSEGVRFLALRSLGDADEAADAAQETIFRAIRAGSEQRPESVKDPAAFIYGIAKHVIADALRGRGKTASAEVTDSIASVEVDALHALVSGEDRARLRAALQQLSPKERTLLGMAYFRGMSSADIARRLGETADSIRKRKSRTVQKLREVFFRD